MTVPRPIPAAAYAPRPPAATVQADAEAQAARAALVAAMDANTRAFGLLAPEDPLPPGAAIAGLRRRRRRTTDDPIVTLTLVERDGALVWEQGAPSAGDRRLARAGYAAGRRMRWGSAAAPVAQYRFRRLPPNAVGAQIAALDASLTPTRGVRRLDLGTWTWHDAPAPRAGRALLLVHGTFSSADGAFGDLLRSDAGRRFLTAAAAQYDAGIHAFDHPTLSVSPLLNAYDLQQAFAGSTCDVDVIAHSRGGLVARWWLEGFGPARAARSRAVLVGAPLAGTSLAAPPRLRAAMSLVTSYGRALQLALGAVPLPFAVVPAVLLQVVTSLTGLAAGVPLVDAAVAMIPGLAGQSRVGDNPELVRLAERLGQGAPTYFAVRSNFEPADPGWRFWRHFRATSLADVGADTVFDGENDLVVDTASMSALGDAAPAPAEVHDFGTNARVHHVNYFAQPETVAFLHRVLGVPG